MFVLNLCFVSRSCLCVYFLFVCGSSVGFLAVFVVWFAEFCVLQCFSILAVPLISHWNSFVFCVLPLNFFCFPCYSLLLLGFWPAIPLLSLGSLLLVPPLQVSGAVTRLTVYRAPPHNCQRLHCRAGSNSRTFCAEQNWVPR